MSRFSRVETNRAQFHGIRPKVRKYEEDGPEYFHLSGVKANHNKYLACTVPSIMGRKFIVACDKAGKFHNPMDKDNGKHNGTTYRNTTKVPFELYLRFLQTKDESYLASAQANTANSSELR